MPYEKNRDAYLEHVKHCPNCNYKLSTSNEDDWAIHSAEWYPGRKIQYYTVWNLCPEALLLLQTLVP